MNARTSRVVVALLTVVLAAPAAGSLADDATDARKKRKKRFKGTATGQVDHGRGQSEVNVDALAYRGTLPDDYRGLGGVRVSGVLTEPDQPRQRARASVVDGTDSARTSADGTAALTFTIDTYGEKRVALTFTKRGYRTVRKTYTFEVGPQEGEAFKP